MAHPTDDANFRLPLHTRPRRYRASLDIDVPGKRFSGEQTVELAFGERTTELVLHARDLEVGRAELHWRGKQLSPVVRAAPHSHTVVFAFPEPVEGEAQLRLSWTGRFCEGLRGLYAAGPVAVTQFEAADARRVFPCFDEPAFKARWAISLKVPKDLQALSNGRIESEVHEGGKRVVTFAETEVLSSYLIALAVGPLVGTPEQTCGQVPVRTWSVPEKAQLQAFGQDVALNTLPRLERYFGLPYAFGKVDQVGVPDFEAGAMENAGLITYREVALLLDPATAPLPMQKRVAEIITHELSHQWFGNWVTMQWWDDLWLNEAFATWIAYKIVDDWRPDWRVWLDFDTGKASALHLDALRSTHPIRGVVRNADEAGEAFDLITYEKGGAVLRMIERFLGEDAFREGIRAYMRRHARANAVADDLWRALGEASSQPVLELANAWIGQSGFPLLSVQVQDRAVHLAQRRFYSEPGVESAERWPVPIVLRFADATGIREQRVLLGDERAQVALETSSPVRWLYANADSTGFYRVSYDGPSLARLAEHRAELSPSERIGLLSDTWALVRSGHADVPAFLDLVSRFGEETDYAVLDELVGRLGYFEHRLVTDQDRPRFQRFVSGLLNAQLSTLGWDVRPDEDGNARLRRAAVVRATGLIARDPKVVAEAALRVQRLLAGDRAALEANLLDAAVSMAARAGSEELFETLRKRFPTESDPATQRRYLIALTTFEHPQLASRAVDLFFSRAVPMQDAGGFYHGLLANRAAREPFFAQVQQRWSDALATTGGAPMVQRKIVDGLGLLTERGHLEAVRKLLREQPVQEAAQASAQTLERLEQDVTLAERLRPKVSAWLAARV